MKRRTFWLLYLMIAILAIAIRFIGLGHIPTGVYWDEAAILADAKKVASTGTDLHDLTPWHLIYPSYGDYKLAPYIWATIFSVKLLGVNYFALRLPSALAGIFTVCIAGLIARAFAEILDFSPKSRDTYQLLSMLVVAITPWSILFSRTGFEGHLGQMFLALAALLLIYYYHPPALFNIKKHRYIIIILLIFAGFFGGFAFWTYFSVRFVWPFVAALIILYFFLRQKNWRQLLLTTGIIALIFLLMYAAMLRDPNYAVSNTLRLSTPSILNSPDLPHLVNAQRLTAGNDLISRLLFSQKFTQISWLARNFSAHLDPGYLFLHGDSNLRHSTMHHGVFYLCFAPFLLLGSIQLFSRDWKMYYLLFGWWLFGLLPASVPTLSVPHALRSLNSLVPACLLISYGFTVWLQFIFHAKYPAKSSKLYKSCLYAITAAIVTGSLAEFLWYYTTVYPHTSATDWEAATPYHAEILMAEKDRYTQLYSIQLDRFLYLWYLTLPEFDVSRLNSDFPSDGYAWHHLDNVNFDMEEVVPYSGRLFFLGKADEIARFLADFPHTDRTDVYDYEFEGVHYLGVGVTGLGAQAE